MRSIPLLIVYTLIIVLTVVWFGISNALAGVLEYDYNIGNQNFNIDGADDSKGNNNFVASSTRFVDKFGLKIWRQAYVIENIDFYLCDDIDCTTEYYHAVIPSTSLSSSTGAFYYIEPTELPRLDLGKTYFFIIEVPSASYVSRGLGAPPGLYNAMDFRIWTVDGIERDLADYYDLSDTCPDILSYDQTCFVGEDCTFWVQYNELTIPADMYAVPLATPYVVDAYDHIIASYNAEFAMPFTLPYVAQATGTIEEICIYTILDQGYDCLFGVDEFVECGYSALWVDREEYERNFSDRMDHLSDLYASSTDLVGLCEGLCDEAVGVGDYFSCAMKKAGCFLFIPSVDTMRDLEMNLNAAKAEFPLSFIYQTKGILDFTASSSVDGLTIRNPLDIVSGASTTLSISSTTITDTIGFPLYNKIYELMEIMLYLIFTSWLFLYIYKTFFKNEVV